MKALMLATSASALLIGMSGAAQAQTSAAAGQNGTTPAPSDTTTTGSATTAAPASPDAGTTPQSTGSLGDIIVTAQRRSENLQRAAVAVDVASGSPRVGVGAGVAGKAWAWRGPLDGDVTLTVPLRGGRPAPIPLNYDTAPVAVAPGASVGPWAVLPAGLPPFPSAAAGGLAL